MAVRISARNKLNGSQVQLYNRAFRPSLALPSVNSSNLAASISVPTATGVSILLNLGEA